MDSGLILFWQQQQFPHPSSRFSTPTVVVVVAAKFFLQLSDAQFHVMPLLQR
ncbi:MAG: hypothetical protein RM347_008265 [Nostoc sp. ChiQUE02]|uniref:hypothetical protein n=1 Tax=Nostoc sp. ChiQUE02 TaxID=3075377 RepID=UPI002AD3FB64|nr:hypothetical protein [Nostoc sp. ChiQUE02]MDZ8233060.1 hypothetical protein [Nostoc sp. ChiQUE02]